jgi:hypothetical protein
LADILTIMPLVNTITSLPISLGGVGVRETLLQALLGHLTHVPPTIAAFTASLGSTNQISWAVVGSGIFLFFKKDTESLTPIAIVWGAHASGVQVAASCGDGLHSECETNPWQTTDEVRDRRMRSPALKMSAPPDPRCAPALLFLSYLNGQNRLHQHASSERSRFCVLRTRSPRRQTFLRTPKLSLQTTDTGSS